MIQFHKVPSTSSRFRSSSSLSELDKLGTDILGHILSLAGDDTEDICDNIKQYCRAAYGCEESTVSAILNALGWQGAMRPEHSTFWLSEMCKTIQKLKDHPDEFTSISYLHPHYIYLGKYVLDLHPYLFKQLIPVKNKYYKEFAKFISVKRWDGILKISMDHPDFVEIALHAMKQRKEAITYMSEIKNTQHPSWMAAITQAAQEVEQFLYWFDWNEVDEDTSFLLKSTALEHFPLQLVYVEKDHPRYADFARIAVAQDPAALEHVPKDHPEYDNIARASPRTQDQNMSD